MSSLIYWRFSSGLDSSTAAITGCVAEELFNKEVKTRILEAMRANAKEIHVLTSDVPI